MEEQVSIGDKVLVGFLRIMVFALIAILIILPVCVLLKLLGIIG